MPDGHRTLDGAASGCRSPAGARGALDSPSSRNTRGCCARRPDPRRVPLGSLRSDASRSASAPPKCRASASAVASPTSRMPERIEKTRQRGALCCADRRVQFLRRFLAHSLQRLDLAGLEAEQIGRRLHPVALHQLIDELVAEPLDVERAARGEMPDLLLALCRTVSAAGAARDGLIGFAHHRRAAHRTALRQLHELAHPRPGAPAAPAPPRESRRRRGESPRYRRAAHPCAPSRPCCAASRCSR